MTLAVSRDTARLDLQAVGLIQPERPALLASPAAELRREARGLFACTDPLARYEAGE